MRVFVTGIAGCVGSHLAARLLAAGHDLAGIDNLATGRIANVPAAVHFEETDVRECGPLLEAWAPDVVVHAAASYRDPNAWREDLAVNAGGTLAVVAASRRAAVERLIYFQTSLCYGLDVPGAPLPITEPLAPRGSYAVSKTAGELYVLGSGLDAISFRLANLYGPRNLSGPVPAFYKRIREGEPCVVAEARRDFVYVGDAVEVFAAAVEGVGAPGVYHVATGSDWPIGELFEILTAELGIEAAATRRPLGPDDVPSILLDPSRTAETFGWEATTELVSGIGEAVEWYDDHGVGDVYTHLRFEETTAK
mgnify:FL=1